ncbi:hypothetical protein CsSME_00006972 [Camellia sinensis var. sinensis]
MAGTSEADSEESQRNGSSFQWDDKSQLFYDARSYNDKCRVTNQSKRFELPLFMLKKVGL